MGGLRSRGADLSWLLGLAIAVFLVYGSSLGYPFFWVDPIDIGLAASRSIPEILTTSQGYLYYRPFAFLLWKLLFALSGRFDPFAFHLAQVLTHALNVWLFYWLSRRIIRRRWVSGIAALLFAWYPFSHQTVTWVIAPQVQATALLLGSAITYYDARVLGDRRRAWLSVALLAIALPFHENAMSFGLVIAALDIFLARNPPLDTEPRAVSLRPLAHIALCVAFAAVWLLIPKDPDSAAARFEPATGWYLLQGFIWPVAGSVGPWREWLGGEAWRPLILVAPPTLLALLAVYLRAKRLSLLSLGLVWFAVMVLPIWATRGIRYVEVSPRILYVAAPGAILIWVGLLTLKANRLCQIAAGVLIGLIVIQSVVFLGVRKELYDETTPAVWDVVRSGAQAGDGAKLLYINTPDQITPVLREFPVGFFRAILMPVSVELGQYAQLHTGIRPSTTSLAVPALAALDAYPYQVDMRGVSAGRAELSAAIRSVDAVYFTEYYPSGGVRIVEAGGVASRSSSRYIASFDHRARLIDAHASQEFDEIRLSLTWECLDRFDVHETVFAHMLDVQGQLAAQADGDPLRGLFPLSECRPGEQIRDVRQIPSLDHEPFTLTVGMYNRSTGERLPATGANGLRAPADAVTIAQTR